MAKADASKGSAAPKVILILLLTAALAVGILLWYHYADNGTISFSFFGKGKVTDFEEALNEHNYQAAVAVYNASISHEAEDGVLNTHLRGFFDLCYQADSTAEERNAYNGLEILRDKISDTVFAEMDAVVYRCYAEEISVQDAKTYIDSIGRFSFSTDRRTVCLQGLDGRDASIKAYNDAVTYYVALDCPKAVEEFKKVLSCDALRYPLAQEGIQKCHDYYCPAQIADAEALLEDDKPDEAKKLLKNLLKVFENDPEATALLATINDR